MMSAVSACALSFGAAIAVERLAVLRGAPRPSLRALPLRLLVFGCLYVFWLGAWGRPFLAGTASLVTVAVLAAISVRKRQLVGEPLNFSDFGLLRTIVRHPDLYYLGFMGRPPFVAGVASFCLIIGIWLWLEPAYAALSGAASAAAALGVPGFAVALWVVCARPGPGRLLRRLVPEPDPERHVARWGLLLTLNAYALRWRSEVGSAPPQAFGADEELAPPDIRPARIVVVQFESFLDPRRAGWVQEELPGLARARRLALLHGPLRVPADGAFTMRSEHAVLSGLSDEALGFRRFDPYLTTKGPAPPTLASRLRARGWRTVFLHPFRAGFFGRDRIVPRLGFERGLFETGFDGDERHGPYVSDRAIVRRILAEFAEPGPVLVYAVTMENHGPWGPGRFADEADPTRQYLRHLRAADEAIGLMIDGLDAMPGTTLLCFYGDHPPILPGRKPSTEPETDYAVLALGRCAPRPGGERPLSADALGRVLARLAGVAGSAEADVCAPTP